MRIALAFRTFFRVLADAAFAGHVESLLEGQGAAQLPATPVKTPAQAAAVPKTGRSDAITLLAALQREARLVDLVQEPLGDYSDAQVGAAARDVLRDCATVLDRLFGLQPLTVQQEGSPSDVPEGFDAGQFRLTGNVQGDPPYHGRLVHHGWTATRCEVPTWAGSSSAKWVVAPQEVELS